MMLDAAAIAFVVALVELAVRVGYHARQLHDHDRRLGLVEQSMREAIDEIRALRRDLLMR